MNHKKQTQKIISFFILWYTTTFIVLSWVWINNVQANNSINNKQVIQQNIKTEINTPIFERKYTKKWIKKEIQKRKKYHKQLLEVYNNDFTNEILLERIKNNWIQLSKLYDIQEKNIFNEKE